MGVRRERRSLGNYLPRQGVIRAKGHLRRPHAAAPEARHQYQGPGQLVFDPGFHRLAPLSLALATLWQAGPFISEQKIRGICEGKMRLCEAKVKSGGSLGEVRRNQQRVTTNMAVGRMVKKSSQGSTHAITALM
ncbi:hypothetical protein D3C79_579290 [compost metagenome]